MRKPEILSLFIIALLCSCAENVLKSNCGTIRNSNGKSILSTFRLDDKISNLHNFSRLFDILVKNFTLQSDNPLIQNDVPVSSNNSKIGNRKTAESEYEFEAYNPKFANDILERHNMYRQHHGVSALVLNRKISNVSQNWADKLARTQQFYHRPNNKYGENLYKMWSSDPTFELLANTPVDAWYAEIKDYNFNLERQPNFMQIGHYSQVVWKNSKELGVGVARDRSGAYYIVCNYNPPGNVMGQFKNNVLPPQNKWNGIGNKVQQKGLELHNKYRKLHNTPSLSLNNHLNKMAQQRASNMATADELKEEESLLGVNIFRSTKKFPISAIIESCSEWYKEGANYNYSNGKRNKNTSSFTQMIWASTEILGIGYEYSNNGTGNIYIAAYYFPEGNIGGIYTDNIITVKPTLVKQ